MNKIKLLLIIISVALSLASCAPSASTIYYAPGPNLKICATISPVYSIASEVITTRQNIALEQIIPPGKTPEDYNLSDAEYQYYSSFDLCLINGLGYDNKIADRLKEINPKITVCVVADQILPIKNSDGTENPYIWTSPLNQLIMYKNIANAVITKDKFPNADDKTSQAYKDYTAAVKEYQARFEYIEKRLLRIIKNIEDPKTPDTRQTFDSADQSDQYFSVSISKDILEELESVMKISSEKKAVGDIPKFAYLLRDCGIKGASASEQGGVKISPCGLDRQISSGEDICLLSDIMLVKEIMPDTCAKITKINIAELRSKFAKKN